jgi:hypothetical protein
VAEVMERLARNWRTAAIAASIHVHAEGRVVTLTGNVERWAGRRSAGRVAAEVPGVRKVRNRIVVRSHPYPWDDREQLPELEGEPHWDPYYFDHPILPWIARDDDLGPVGT